MKRKDYYPSYIPRKWIHFAEHGRKYRIRKKYRNRILQTVSSHPSDFETVLFNVMQHTSRSGITTAEFCRGLTAPPLPDYFRDCSPDDGMGSKAKVARYIVPIIQEQIERSGYETYLEPFCGGCNVIDKIEAPQRIASDCNRRRRTRAGMEKSLRGYLQQIQRARDRSFWSSGTRRKPEGRRLSGEIKENARNHTDKDEGQPSGDTDQRHGLHNQR